MRYIILAVVLGLFATQAWAGFSDKICICAGNSTQVSEGIMRYYCECGR